MTGFNHGMTGAVIALTVKNPVLAIPISFLSHFIQDIVPHWDYGVRRINGKQPGFFDKKFDKTLLADFLFSVFLMTVLALMFPTQKWLIWGCMIAAASPDLMWAYYRLYLEHIKKRELHYDPLARLHLKVQWSQTAQGLWVELVWFVLANIIVLIIKF